MLRRVAVLGVIVSLGCLLAAPASAGPRIPPRDRCTGNHYFTFDPPAFSITFPGFGDTESEACEKAESTARDLVVSHARGFCTQQCDERTPKCDSGGVCVTRQTVVTGLRCTVAASREVRPGEWQCDVTCATSSVMCICTCVH